MYVSSNEYMKHARCTYLQQGFLRFLLADLETLGDGDDEDDENDDEHQDDHNPLSVADVCIK